MSWLRVDDGFTEHPKVMDLTDRAFRLHVAAMCFCARNLTDGELAARSVKVVCALTAATRKHMKELVDAGLWIANAEGGFEVKDFLDYNPPADRVKEDRAKARDRMRRVRGERSGERSPTPDQSPSPPQVLEEAQSQEFKPPEQTQATVAALVDQSLKSAQAPAGLCDVTPLIDLLPPSERAANTRGVLERKFAQLPPHFVDLAREELIAADGVNSRIRYLNGIADRMIRDLDHRQTPEQARAAWVNEHAGDPDADAVIAGWADAPTDERAALHDRAERIRNQPAARQEAAA